jgi:hypothetical protein
MIESREMFTYEHVGTHFDSFYDMTRSMRVPKPMVTLNISRMILERDAAAARTRATSGTGTTPDP